LRQAQEAFAQVEQLGRFDGPLNLARAQFAEGDLAGATEAIARAAGMDPSPPPWTLAWLSGEVSRQQGLLEQAARSFRSILEDQTSERSSRDFDFSRDYRIRNALGLTLIDLAEKARARKQTEEADDYFRQATEQFLATLKIDSEDVAAHANLARIYARTDEPEKAQHHQELQLRYKPDDNARDVAVPAARRKYPAGDHAAEPLVIYDLHRTIASNPE
jgi:tetratricopeptide (TPR) repeat protein